MCAVRAMMSSAINIKFLYARTPNELPEREVSVSYMRIHRNHAPDDFISSRSQARQGHVQQRAIRAIQVHIAFVHFLPRLVEDLDAAEGWFDVLRKSDSHFVRR